MSSKLHIIIQMHYFLLWLVYVLIKNSIFQIIWAKSHRWTFKITSQFKLWDKEKRKESLVYYKRLFISENKILNSITASNLPPESTVPWGKAATAPAIPVSIFATKVDVRGSCHTQGLRPGKEGIQLIPEDRIGVGFPDSRILEQGNICKPHFHWSYSLNSPHQ